MDQTQAYVVDSLELHLFFSRIMKEHALFLKVGFLPPNAGFAKQSEHFLRRFEGILSRTITLSDHVVRQCVLTSGEICTESLRSKQNSKPSGSPELPSTANSPPAQSV